MKERTRRSQGCQKLAEEDKAASPLAFRRRQELACNPDLSPAELQGNTFPIVKLLSLWYFLMAGLGLGAHNILDTCL